MFMPACNIISSNNIYHEQVAVKQKNKISRANCGFCISNIARKITNCTKHNVIYNSRQRKSSTLIELIKISIES